MFVSANKMKKGIFTFLCVGLLSIVFLPSLALATATSTSGATITWGTFAFSGAFSWVDGTAGNLSGIDSGLNRLHDPYVSDYIDGGFGSTSVAVNHALGGLLAQSVANMNTAGTLFPDTIPGVAIMAAPPVSASGLANALASVTGFGQADVFVVESVFTHDFTVTEAGTLTVTAEYTYFQELFSDSAGSFVSSNPEAGLFLYDDVGYDPIASAVAGVSTSFYGPGLILSGLQSGPLSLTFDLAPGYYTFEASATGSASAAVPEPGLILLLGSGLIGLGILRKRKIR
jgi:hypothetical protein